MNRGKIKFKTKIAGYILILLFSAGSTVYGDIYRYIDENGVMHFTNTPTSSSKKYKLFIREKPKLTPPLFN